jgi:hypothetical protein
MPVDLSTQGANSFTLIAADGSRSPGTATASIFYDSVPPALTITAPLNGASFSANRINVTGAFTEPNLKQIMVNGIPAVITGNSYTALNVPLVGIATRIATSEFHSLALRADGTVFGWGEK